MEKVKAKISFSHRTSPLDAGNLKVEKTKLN